jgi:hypothetical protein
VSEIHRPAHKEACVTINGVELTPAQSMTLRVALSVWDASCGDDKLGKSLQAAYLRRTTEILKVMGAEEVHEDIALREMRNSPAPEAAAPDDGKQSEQAGVPDTKQARADHTKLIVLLEAAHDMANESPRTPDTVSVTSREYKAVRKLDMCYDALSRTLVLMDKLLAAAPDAKEEP